jgi:HSP20 family protein
VATVRWWSPTGDMMTATRLMDRLLDQLGYTNTGTERVENGTPTFTLPVDVLETDDSFLLYATVAGVPGDGVDVTFEDGVLTVTAKAAPFDQQGRWLRQERPWGNWSRKLELPKEVDPARIRADVSDGVLTVVVPKAATAQAVRIPVSTTRQQKGLGS